MKRVPVWDLPIRLFHWLLLAGIVFAYVSGHIGGELIKWHARAGLFIAGLLVFRVSWGFVGTRTARFAAFVRGPGAIRRAVRGQWQGIGHSPLGALSVLALLAGVAAQVATGLFANDDIAYAGPLAALVDKNLSDVFHTWHERLQNGLAMLIMLHVAAILFYRQVKREDLVAPMVRGWKLTTQAEPMSGASHALPQAPGAGAWRGGALAFVLAVTIAAGAVYAAAGGLLTPALASAPPPTW